MEQANGNTGLILRHLLCSIFVDPNALRAAINSQFSQPLWFDIFRFASFD